MMQQVGAVHSQWVPPWDWNAMQEQSTCIYKKERQIKALSVLCPFLFLTFFVGAGCSRLASLIEVIGRGLIEVSLYPLISAACKDSFLCRLWFGVISVAGTCEALLLYLRFVCWIPDCYLSLIFLSLFLCFPGVLQVSISLKKVELSVGESKFFTCTGQFFRSTTSSRLWRWCIWDRCMNAHNLRSADSSSH